MCINIFILNVNKWNIYAYYTKHLKFAHLIVSQSHFLKNQLLKIYDFTSELFIPIHVYV